MFSSCLTLSSEEEEKTCFLFDRATTEEWGRFGPATTWLPGRIAYSTDTLAELKQFSEFFSSRREKAHR